jgi:hypothetical protein
LLSGAAILLQNVRFAQIAIDHIRLPRSYSLRQFAANRNNQPKKKIPDVINSSSIVLAFINKDSLIKSIIL